MERGQAVGYLSEDLRLKQQRENSLRSKLGKSAAGAILLSSSISFPVDASSQFDSGFSSLIIESSLDYSPVPNPEKSEVVAYDHTFDIKAYEAIRSLPYLEMIREKERLDAYTDKQLQTILAERLNVLTNTFYYDMKDGKLWGMDMNEPALNSYKRGRDYRRIYGNPIDFPREDSEIEGFEKIEEMLRDGKSVLSISPRGVEGSIYQHNFYDVFMWKDGKIEANRFSSGLTLEEYKEKLGINGDFKDSDFLASPIDISGIFETAEDIHRFFHKDHKFTDTNFFNNVIIPFTQQQRGGAIEGLWENDEYKFGINFNGMFNLSDDLAAEHSRNPNQVVFISPGNLSEEEIEALGHREVEKIEVGCGTSSGVKLMKPMLNSLVEEARHSVKEFDEINKKCEDCQETSIDNHYHCPGCKKKYADETSKIDRTEECNCGFAFGCKKDG